MSESTPFRTGGYIAANCTKCDMTLGHTIVAMVGPRVVKVKCNTCGSDHVYRGEKPPASKGTGSSAASGAKGRGAGAAAKAGPTWEQRMKDINVVGARKYSPKTCFGLDDVIDHPTFGLGVVIANRADKIDVAFKGADKTLVNGPSPNR